MAVLAVAATVALAGCAPTPESVYSVAVRQAMAEVASLDPDALEQVAMRRSAEVEADIWSLSGLDDALDGAAKTSDIVSSVLTATSQWVAREREQPSEIHLASTMVSPASVATTIGLGFIAVDTVTGNAVAHTNDGTSGAQTGQLPGGNSGVSVSEDGTVHAEVSTGGTVSGVSTTITAATDLNPCPTPDGRLEMSADVTVRVERGGGGASLEMHVDATGMLDDDANLVGSNYEYRQQYASFAGGAGEFLDHSATAAGDVTVNRHSDGVTSDFVTGAAQAAALMAAVVANNLQEAAEKGWESGRCVTVELTPSDGPDDLEPDANLTIDAAPRSAVDGLPTGGNVVATFAGEGTLDPTGSRLDAPATLHFTAPSERDKAGTVTVESRSNRGIGTATLTLSTSGRSYAATGGREEYSGAGTICSLTAPFTIPGNTITFDFTPTGESGGTWTAAGGAFELTFTGNGSYTVIYSDDHATTIVLNGTVATIAPDGSRYPGSADLEFSLTPTSTCS